MERTFIVRCGFAVAVSMLAVYGLFVDGAAWRPLRPNELQHIRAGSCFYNMVNTCPPAQIQHACVGCDPQTNYCNWNDGNMTNTSSYSTCTGTYAGLTDCSLPQTIFCWIYQTCNTNCIYVGNQQWSCTVKSNQNIVPETQTFATGDDCYIAFDGGKHTRARGLLASLNGVGFNAFR